MAAQGVKPMPEEESRPWPWRLWRSMGRTESAEQMAFKVAHASRLGAVGSVLGSVHGGGVGWGGVGWGGDSERTLYLCGRVQDGPIVGCGSNRQPGSYCHGVVRYMELTGPPSIQLG